MSDKSRWFFVFCPATSWFTSFVDYFESPDIRLWSEDSDGVPSYFAWESQHLNDVASAKEFVDRAGALKAIFDGAMYISRGLSYSPLRLERATAYDDDDRKFIGGSMLEADVTVEPFSKTIMRRRFSSSINPLDNEVGLMLFLARYDDIVRAMLKFTGVQGLSYLTLYAYRDWMKSGGWDDARIAAEAGWSNSQLRDFTYTANNPAYLGPFSRHGGVQPLPKRPMILQAAEAPILRAVRAFFSERAGLAEITQKYQSLIT